MRRSWRARRPIKTIDEVMSAPPIKARGMRISLDHYDKANVEMVGHTIKFSRTPISYTVSVLNRVTN